MPDLLSSLSNHTGLSLDPASARLSGDYRGRPVEIAVAYEQPCPDNASTHTLTWIVAGVANPDGLQLSLWPAGSYAYLVSVLLGAPEASSGDPGFDHRFMIKAAPREAALRLLTSDGARADLTAIEGVFHLELDGYELSFAYYADPPDATAVERWLNAVCDIADAADH